MKKILNKNIKVAILIIFESVIFACSLILLQPKQVNQNFPSPSELPIPPKLPIDRKLGESGWTQIGVYKNTTDGYTIEYPALYLSPKIEIVYPHSVAIIRNDLALAMEEKGVSLLSFGDIMITVNPMSSSLDENVKKFESWQKFVKKTKIAGYDAIILTEKSPHPIPYYFCKDNRKALFIKDKKLFMIDTCTIDHERIWASFKFDK